MSLFPWIQLYIVLSVDLISANGQQNGSETDYVSTTLIPDPKIEISDNQHFFQPENLAQTTVGQSENSAKFNCDQMQQCEIQKDDHTAQIVGTLERKLVKIDNENAKLKKDLATILDSISACPCINQNANLSSPPNNALPNNPSRSNIPSSEEYHPLQTIGPNPRCLDGGATGSPGPIMVKRCIPSSQSQAWKLTNNGTSFINQASQLCLDVSASESGGIQVLPCDKQKASQQWNLSPTNTIGDARSEFCLSAGAYWALSAVCDGEGWQLFDYWGRLQSHSQRSYYLVPLHF